MSPVERFPLGRGNCAYSSATTLPNHFEHIWMVIGIARTCRTMPELQDKMAEMYRKIPVQYTLYLPGRAERIS
jgi:hypothetical protein